MTTNCCLFRVQFDIMSSVVRVIQDFRVFQEHQDVMVETEHQEESETLALEGYQAPKAHQEQQV